MFLWTFNPNGRAKSADLGRERLFFSHTDLYVDKFFFRNVLIQQIKRVELLLLHPFYSVNLWDVELSIACSPKHYKQIYSVKSAKCENINFTFFFRKAYIDYLTIHRSFPFLLNFLNFRKYLRVTIRKLSPNFFLHSAKFFCHLRLTWKRAFFLAVSSRFRTVRRIYLFPYRKRENVIANTARDYLWIRSEVHSTESRRWVWNLISRWKIA